MTANTAPVEDPRLLTVDRVMTRHPVVIDPDDTLWAALNTLLASGLRHLVVAHRDGRCVGVLSDRYVVAEWPLDALGSHVTHVRQMLDDDRAQIGRRHTVADAARLMLEIGTDALAVVDDADRVVGVLTGSDLLRTLADQPAVGSSNARGARLGRRATSALMR